MNKFRLNTQTIERVMWCLIRKILLFHLDIQMITRIKQYLIRIFFLKKLKRYHTFKR